MARGRIFVKYDIITIRQNLICCRHQTFINDVNAFRGIHGWPQENYWSNSRRFDASPYHRIWRMFNSAENLASTASPTVFLSNMVFRDLRYVRGGTYPWAFGLKSKRKQLINLCTEGRHLPDIGCCEKAFIQINIHTWYSILLALSLQ